MAHDTNTVYCFLKHFLLEFVKPDFPVVTIYSFKGGFLRDKFIRSTQINSPQNLFSKKLRCKKVEIIPSQSELNFDEN